MLRIPNQETAQKIAWVNCDLYRKRAKIMEV